MTGFRSRFRKEISSALKGKSKRQSEPLSPEEIKVGHARLAPKRDFEVFALWGDKRSDYYEIKARQCFGS